MDQIGTYKNHALGQLSRQSRTEKTDDPDYDFSVPDPNAYQFAVDPSTLRWMESQKAMATRDNTKGRELDDISAVMTASKNQYRPQGRYAPVVQAKHKAKGLSVVMESEYEFRKRYNTAHKSLPKSQASKPKHTKVKAMEKTSESVSNAAKHGIATMQSTDKYHLFKILDTNRTVNKKHVATLVKAIQKKNLLHLNPLVVDGDMNIIDGQHRLEAAKRLNVPVYYTKDDGVSENDIASLNSNKRNWTGEDYIKFYAKKGVPQFVAFTQLASRHPEINQSLLITLVSSIGKRNSPAIREGVLDVGRIEQADRILEQLNDFKAITALAYTSRFVEAFAFIVAHPEYDHSRLVQKVQLNPGALQPRVSKKEYILLLQNIFNYRVHENNIVLFLKR